MLRYCSVKREQPFSQRLILPRLKYISFLFRSIPSDYCSAIGVLECTRPLSLKTKPQMPVTIVWQMHRQNLDPQLAAQATLLSSPSIHLVVRTTLVANMNEYINSKLPMMYGSYDAIAPQKYAGKLQGKVVCVHGSTFMGGTDPHSRR